MEKDKSKQPYTSVRVLRKTWEQFKEECSHFDYDAVKILHGFLEAFDGAKHYENKVVKSNLQNKK